MIQCSVLSVQYNKLYACQNASVKYLAQWLSWLERRPVTAEVVGSSPIWVVRLNDYV